MNHHKCYYTCRKWLFDTTVYSQVQIASFAVSCKYTKLRCSNNWAKHFLNEMCLVYCVCAARLMKHPNKALNFNIKRKSKRPHLEYASTVCSPCNRAWLIWWRKFCQICIHYTSSVTSMLSKLQWDSLQLWRDKSHPHQGRIKPTDHPDSGQASHSVLQPGGVT